MHLKRKTRDKPPIFTLGLVLFLCGLALGILPPATADPMGASIALADQTDHEAALDVRSIELKRRNWENHGTNTKIAQDHSFVVTAQLPGRSKMVREGKLTKQKFEDLVRSIGDADIFALKDEYEPAPLTLTSSWWGYEVSITTNTEVKTIRFHSEDETVPASLRILIDHIMTAAAGSE